nr:group II intron maturase-specific domain-containing protein [Halanaerobium polyolivorans]
MPVISNKAKKHIRSTIKSWYLLHQTQITLAEIAEKYNVVLRGWLNYYGFYGKNELKKVLHHMNNHLVMWVIRKFDKLKTKKMKARKLLNKIAKEKPNLFSYWVVGVLPMTG